MLIFVLIVVDVKSQDTLKHNSCGTDFIYDINNTELNNITYSGSEFSFVFCNKKDVLLYWLCGYGDIQVSKIKKNLYTITALIYFPIYKDTSRVYEERPVLQWLVNYEDSSILKMNTSFEIPIDWNRDSTLIVIEKYKSLLNDSNAISTDWNISTPYANEITILSYQLLIALINDNCLECRDLIFGIKNDFNIMNAGAGSETVRFIEELARNYKLGMKKSNNTEKVKKYIFFRPLSP